MSSTRPEALPPSPVVGARPVGNSWLEGRRPGAGGAVSKLPSRPVRADLYPDQRRPGGDMSLGIKQRVELLIIHHGLYPESRVRNTYEKELEDWESRGNPLPLPNLLKQRVVLEYGRQFGLHTLVETGTYWGAMVEACKDAFTRIYSIELQKDFYCRARKKFAPYRHVKILHGDSAALLPGLLADISEGALFWLDAHYSGGLTAKGQMETPAMRELELIWSHQVKRHIILVDDARLFDGTHDYPTLSFLSRRAALSGWSCQVKDDIIRLKWCGCK